MGCSSGRISVSNEGNNLELEVAPILHLRSFLYNDTDTVRGGVERDPSSVGCDWNAANFPCSNKFEGEATASTLISTAWTAAVAGAAPAEKMRDIFISLVGVDTSHTCVV